MSSHFPHDDSKSTPCKICRRPTLMLGTSLCDFCWQMDGNINPLNAWHALKKAQEVLGVPLVFTNAELSALADDPDALQSLIDWHDYQESCADGMDMPKSANHHKGRRQQLQAVRDAAIIKRQKDIDG